MTWNKNMDDAPRDGTEMKNIILSTTAISPITPPMHIRRGKVEHDLHEHKDAKRALMGVRGAILAEIHTNQKEANVSYWTERLHDLDYALDILYPQPPEVEG